MPKTWNIKKKNITRNLSFKNTHSQFCSFISHEQPLKKTAGKLVKENLRNQPLIDI